MCELDGSLPYRRTRRISLLLQTRMVQEVRGFVIVNCLLSVNMIPYLYMRICVGYQRLKENVTNGKADNHEGLDFYAPVENPDKTKPLHGENQWPSDEVVPGFRERYERWVEKMKKLGMIVMEA